MMHTVPPETSADFEAMRILERPDGFYWQMKDTEEIFGPFVSLQDAIADMQYTAENDFEAGDRLLEAEQELGIAEWVNPETGERAEESIPRIEDH